MVARGVNYYFVGVGFLVVDRLGLDPAALPPAHARVLLGGDARPSRRSPSPRSRPARTASSRSASTSPSGCGSSRPWSLDGALRRGRPVLPAHPAVLVRRRRLGDGRLALGARAARRSSSRNRIYRVPWDWPRIGGVPRAHARALSRVARRGRLDSARHLAPRSSRDHRRLPVRPARHGLLSAGRPGRGPFVAAQVPQAAAMTTGPRRGSPLPSRGHGSPSRARIVGATSRRSRSGPAPRLDTRRREHVQPLVGVVRIVGPGVVLEHVDGAGPDLADRAPVEVAEVDEQVGRRSRCARRRAPPAGARPSRSGWPFSSPSASSFAFSSSRTRS